MKSLLLYVFAACTLVILGSASGCGETKTDTNVEVANQEETSQNEAMTVASEEKEIVMEDKNAKVKISTQFGDMIVELYDETPQHRDNFIKLVEEGFYNDLLFHRVIKGFMVQGGDPDSKGAAPNMPLGSGGPGYTVPAEFVDTLVHMKGALSAARQGDQMNPEKRSSGSQFYVVQGKPVNPQFLLQMEQRRNARRDSSNYFKYTDAQIEQYATVGGTPHLDGDYTVFGQVIEGLDIIDSIAAVQTARGDRPVEDVKMTMELMD